MSRQAEISTTNDSLKYKWSSGTVQFCLLIGTKTYPFVLLFIMVKTKRIKEVQKQITDIVNQIRK